jgi:hypothetical protein
MPAALAKGSDDKPVVMQIDPNGNDVDVNSLPAVKIDGSQNEVDATISNEVEIKNHAGAALAVDTGAAVRIPYARRMSASADDNVIDVSLTVPDDHIFVIEYISAGFGSHSGDLDQLMFIRLDLKTGGFPAGARLPSQFASADGDRQYWVANAMLRLYADPGSTVSFHAAARPTDSLISALVFLSGYLIPLDEPSLSP